MTGADKAVVLGVDGSTEYPIDSVTIDSLTSLTFKLAASGVAIPSPQLANRPYKVKLTGNAGLTVTSTQTIGFSGLSWTSPAAGATLAVFNTTASANNTELDATDDVGGSGVTFSVPANNLPSPLALNPSTGAITGQIAAVTAAGGVSVTFRVTDNVTGTFAERTFSIVGIAELYEWTQNPFTFTNAGQTGKDGPTLYQLTTAYSPTWTDYSSNVNVSGGIQLWTVPKDGSYTINAYGAMGGSVPGSAQNGNSFSGGSGARMSGNFTLTAGEIIKIVVGQMGTYGQHTQASAPKWAASGGGGTYVVRTPYNTTASILVIAGGGGGAANNQYTQKAGYPGRTGQNGGQGGNSSGGGQNNASTLGQGGLGGTGSGQGPGGAGFTGNGDDQLYNNSGLGQHSKSFTNGSRGGYSAIGWGYSHIYGGFGGGGGGGGLSSGGGGGYTGGDGGIWSQYQEGGGGGSYNSGTSQSNSAGANAGHGYVTVTQL